MPSKKTPPPKRKVAAARRPAKAGTSKFDLRCKDCGFVAAHPMGLGRHRSTRHGAISKRASRGTGAAAGGTSGAWITRQQAAERAGVHYNTIRQWERSGSLRKGSSPGARETLVSAVDVVRLSAMRGGGGVSTGGGLSAVDAARLSAIERTQRELADGLERLAASLRAGVMAAATPTAVRKAGRPLGSRNAPKKATAKKATAKRATAKKAAPKRVVAKKRATKRSANAKRRKR